MKRRRIVISMMIGIAVIFALLVLYSITFVHFKDKNMGIRLAYETGKKSRFFVTQADLDQIEEISIGPTCYYETIIDLAKCHNMRRLVINNYNPMFSSVQSNWIFGYKDRGDDIIANEDNAPDKIKRLQDDLTTIFMNCPNIVEFIVSEMDERNKDKVGYNPDCLMYTQFTDISFLEYERI